MRIVVVQDEIVDIASIVHWRTADLGHSPLRLLHLVGLLHL